MSLVTTLTSKGQVTIPKEIRDELGLKPRDRIRFGIEDGRVVLRKAYLSLEELAGCIPPLAGISVEEAIERSKADHAQELVEKMKNW